MHLSILSDAHVLPASHFLALQTVAQHSPLFAAALVASAWQGLLLTSLVALCLRPLSGLSAAARSAVWTGVLLLVAALPVLFLTSSRPASSPLAVVHLEETVSLALVALWAAGSALRFAQLIGGAVRLRGVLRRATPIEAGAEVTLLLRDARPVRLCTSAHVDRPSVAGFFRPSILLPTDLLPQLSEADLRHIVLHEMEHLRRHDDWLNLLQQVSLLLFPLNPALFWLDRRLSLERELACDEGVLQTTRARKAYAACLARVAEGSLLRRGASLALGVLGDWKRRPELAQRVERILAVPHARLGRAQMRFATGVVIAGVFGSGALLAHSPTLISFGPVMNTGYAQAAAAPAADWPAPSAGAPRATLVKAVMPAHTAFVNAMLPSPNGTTAPLASAKALRSVHLRSAARSHVRPRTARWVVLTTWHPSQMNSWSSTRTVPTALRLAPVVIEDSQIWYTAVAWRDGWIVVQL